MAALRLFLALLASLLLLVAIFVGIIRSGEPPGTPQAQPRAHQEGLRGMWLPQRSPGLHQTKAHGALRLSPDQAPQSKEALHSMQSPHSKQALLSKAPNSAVLHSAASNERLPVAGGSHCTRGCTRKTFLGSLLQGLRASLATAASSRSLLGVSLRAPYKGCTVSFKNKKRSFSRCTTLDSARKFRLAWTLNKKTGVALTWFEGPPDKAYGWVSWGISPSGKMQNSDVIVAYGNPLQTAKARVRPYFLAGVKPEQVRPRVCKGWGLGLCYTPLSSAECRIPGIAEAVEFLAGRWRSLVYQVLGGLLAIPSLFCSQVAAALFCCARFSAS